MPREVSLFKPTRSCFFNTAIVLGQDSVPQTAFVPFDLVPFQTKFIHLFRIDLLPRMKAGRRICAHDREFLILYSPVRKERFALLALEITLTPQ